MKKILKSLTMALLCGTLVNFTTAPLTAQPAPGRIGAFAGSNQSTSAAEPIASRNRRGVLPHNNGFNNHNKFNNRHTNRSRRNNGGNIGLGLGAAVIGGILLSGSARAKHRRSHASAWKRCDRTYRTFEWNTGMYTVRPGVRRICPYLR